METNFDIEDAAQLCELLAVTPRHDPVLDFQVAKFFGVEQREFTKDTSDAVGLFNLQCQGLTLEIEFDPSIGAMARVGGIAQLWCEAYSIPCAIIHAMIRTVLSAVEANNAEQGAN